MKRILRPVLARLGLVWASDYGELMAAYRDVWRWWERCARSNARQDP